MKKLTPKAEEILEIINECFFQPIVEYIDNFDDINEGFRISVSVGVVIELKFRITDSEFDPYMMIKGYEIDFYNSNQKEKVIFKGDIPPNEAKDDIDYNVIKTIFQNYKSFLK